MESTIILGDTFFFLFDQIACIPAPVVSSVADGGFLQDT